MTTNIETYLDSLSQDIKIIDISCKGIISLPDLTRFKNLKELNLDKSRVRNVTNTSEVTINKCYKKLSDISKEENIIPPLMLKKYNRVL